MSKDQVEGDWFSFTTTAASLNELRDQNPELFHDPEQQRRQWFNHSFAEERGESGRKLQIRTSAAPGSFDKTFAEQQELLSDGEFVPTTGDLVEGMITYYRATGQMLFCGYWVRTADVLAIGRRILVRFFRDGLSVHSERRDDHCVSFLGLAVARKDANTVR